MSTGQAPQVAPDVLDEPHYRDAPLLNSAPVRAYIGVPLRRADGSLYGTLCGFDPSPREPQLASHLPYVRLQARLLGTLLEHDLELAEIVRRAERAELESLADPLTGAYNRRGWMRLLKSEEARCRRYGHGAGVLMADLDNLKIINDTLGHDAGDALLVRAARALGSVVRHGDAVARIGGDEFAVLAIGVGQAELDQLAMRADKALRDAEVEATLGTGLRDRDQPLAQAYRQADLAMLQLKHGKRARLRDGLPGNSKP
jgi:diguanylate cyclase (GGDEF)-like protein